MPKTNPLVYGEYTQDELNAQYDQTTLVPDLSPYFTQWEERSNIAKNRFDPTLDVPYGPSEDQRLDIFRSTTSDAPVQVFLHGGAWTRGNKELFWYPAEVLVPAGACYVVPEFSLAPSATMDEMVRQVRAAYAWVFENIADYGGDPNRIFASGHSSGAHLTAMVLAEGWREAAGLPEELIKGAVLVSGPYDLEPVRLSARNEYLHLDEAAAHRNTSIRHFGPGTPPLFIGWGDGDLPEFKRLSSSFANACSEKGISVTWEEFKDCNHFDGSYGFGDPDHPITRIMLTQMGLA